MVAGRLDGNPQQLLAFFASSGVESHDHPASPVVGSRGTSAEVGATVRAVEHSGRRRNLEKQLGRATADGDSGESLGGTGRSIAGRDPEDHPLAVWTAVGPEKEIQVGQSDDQSRRVAVESLLIDVALPPPPPREEQKITLRESPVQEVGALRYSSRVNRCVSSRRDLSFTRGET
jgi:hypothetical protein